MKRDISPKRQGGVASTWIFAGFAVVALFFLLAEHRAHLFGWLPYLLLAACPLMHLFHGHGGHNGHRSRGADGSKKSAAPTPPSAHHHH